MKNRYSIYWFFGALVFFFLGAVFTYQMAEMYQAGLQHSSTFDVRLLWVAVGTCLVMTFVCLAFSQPLDLLNYISRLEKTVKGQRRCIESYERDAVGADRRHYAKDILDKNGRLHDIKIHYIEEGRKGA